MKMVAVPTHFFKASRPNSDVPMSVRYRRFCLGKSESCVSLVDVELLYSYYYLVGTLPCPCQYSDLCHPLALPPPLPPPPTPSQVIVAEPFPSPEAEASRVPPTTFVAAFAMPNLSIPNHTDLRNFLVPLETLESVSGMRFLGEASDSGDLDDDAKAFLDEEAMQERARAGLPPFSEFFGGEAPSTGCRRIESAEHVAREKRRLFRHLCTATSCVGV